MDNHILFIHRSCGENLLRQGHVRELLAIHSPPSKFEDYNQNKDRLVEVSGGQSFFKIDFLGNDTTPKAYAAFFSQANQDDTMLQRILKAYDTIVIKSCYPNNAIVSDEQLKELQGCYKSIASFFAAYPEKQLGIMTTPPLLAIKTNPQEAARARKLANWLANTKLGNNIYVFDFYDHLATAENQPSANTLRKDYQRLWVKLGISDSHPNRKANEEAAPEFVEWVSRVRNKEKSTTRHP